MEFTKRKTATLTTISSTQPDKSPKGTLDKPILHLINTINSHPSYFTTSSCSGRISILSQPLPSTPSTTLTPKKKAKGGSWLFITHERADPNSVIDLLFNSPNSVDEGDLVFRFEPFILAVECRDVNAAQGLVSTAVSCGFRESGISSVHKRVIVGIRCSIRLEVPLGVSGKVMVSKEYVRFLVGLANEKMESNRKRTECFLQVFERNLLGDQMVVSEEKDGRSSLEAKEICGSEKGNCEAESELKRAAAADQLEAEYSV